MLYSVCKTYKKQIFVISPRLGGIRHTHHASAEHVIATNQLRGVNLDVGVRADQS